MCKPNFKPKPQAATGEYVSTEELYASCVNLNLNLDIRRPRART